MKRLIGCLVISFVAVVTMIVPAHSQDATPAAPTEPTEETKKLYDAFAKKMTNSTLVGNFTVDGQTGSLTEERYDLKSVSKMPRGDYWLFKARIRYGDHDVTVPLPLEVKWAGQTPVITLNNVPIPGLGTFDARVLIDGNRYAGTWQHGEVGGLLFGRVETSSTEEDTDAEGQGDSTESSDDE